VIFHWAQAAPTKYRDRPRSHESHCTTSQKLDGHSSPPYLRKSRAFCIGLAMVVVRHSVCQRCIVAKRCEMEHRLFLITNRKSHIGFQLTCISLTLDDLEGLKSQSTMVCQSCDIVAKW